MSVIISSVNTRYWFWFFRKCLKWQSLYLHVVQVFTKAQRSVHSTYNIDFVISNKYWTWLSNCLYHQLSYKVITACNNSCFLSNVTIHWNSEKKTSIIQDEQAAIEAIGDLNWRMFYWQHILWFDVCPFTSVVLKVNIVIWRAAYLYRNMCLEWYHWMIMNK